MSAIAQKATLACDRATSALPLKADIGCCSAHVCNGPQAEMMPAALFSHTAPWMSLAPSITGPLYLKLPFLRLQKKLSVMSGPGPFARPS